jgi:threonine dehydratase
MSASDLVPTPVQMIPSRHFFRLFVKDETAQRSGAFKYRGASALIQQTDDRRPLVAASTGNHAGGLALAAADAGMKLVVFIPKTTPETKLMRIREAGAEAVPTDGGYDQCEDRARSYALDEGYRFIHSFDDNAIIDGHRSLFAELRHQVGRFDRLYVPIGGGGLVTAAIRELGNEVRVTGVEHVAATAMHTSLAVGERVSLEEPSGPEGLCVRRVGAIAFMEAYAYGLEVKIISDAPLNNAMRLLWTVAGIRAERAGAAATAAALTETDGLSVGSSAVCVVSGGNIDDAVWEKSVGILRRTR